MCMRIYMFVYVYNGEYDRIRSIDYDRFSYIVIQNDNYGSITCAV